MPAQSLLERLTGQDLLVLGHLQLELLLLPQHLVDLILLKFEHFDQSGLILLLLMAICTRTRIAVLGRPLEADSRAPLLLSVPTTV